MIGATFCRHGNNLRQRMAAIICRPRGAEDGFTLLEILVALAVLGFSLAVLLTTFALGLDRTKESQNRFAAQALAQELLLHAEIAEPKALADQTGVQPPGYRWQVHVAPYDAAQEREGWRVDVVRISVSVRWTDHGRERVVSLSTLRFGERHG